MANERIPRYTLKPSTTPLPSQIAQQKADAKRTIDISNVTSENPTQTASTGLPVRLKDNEDDDLYDPYSDYMDGTLREMKFEIDPWR